MIVFDRFKSRFQITRMGPLLELILPACGHQLVQLIGTAKRLHSTITILKKGVNTIGLYVAVGLTGKREQLPQEHAK